jgi:cysteine-rich repeat protein
MSRFVESEIDTALFHRSTESSWTKSGEKKTTSDFLSDGHTFQRMLNLKPLWFLFCLFFALALCGCGGVERGTEGEEAGIDASLIDGAADVQIEKDGAMDGDVDGEVEQDAQVVDALTEECGNGVVEGDEECDDGTNGDPCDGCLDDCTEHENICGDGYLCGNETCDGSDLGNAGCMDFGFSSGMLRCSADCEYDFGSCLGGCGNGRVEPGEICDDGNDIDRDGCDNLCRASSGGFDACTSYPVGDLNVSDITMIDMNEDGHLDAVLSVGCSWAQGTKIMLGDGAGEFTEASFVSHSGSSEHVVADVNGDGCLDIMVSGHSNRVFYVLYSDCSGTLTLSSTVSCEPNGQSMSGILRDLAVADFNEDGNKDIACYFDESVATICFAYGDGSGGFLQPQGSMSTGVAPTSGAEGSLLRVADFDADGDSDLSVVGTDGVEVYLNDGVGNFSMSWDNAYTAGANSKVQVCDVDADGNDDVIMSLQSPEVVDVFLGQGDGTFYLKSSNASGRNCDNLVCGHFDNDKVLDMAVPVGNNDNPHMHFFFGRGDGTFEPVVAVPTDSGNGYGLAAGDFDEDGALDLALTCYLSGDKLCFLYGQPQASACDPPAWGTVTFEDSFEGGTVGQEVYGTNGWTSANAGHDRVLYSGSMALCGSIEVSMTSYVGEQNAIHSTNAGQYFTAQVWMYDTLANQGTAHLFVHTTDHSGGRLGYHEDGGDFYWVYTDDPLTEIVTTKERTVGWHKLAVRRTPDGTYYYVDGEFVGRTDKIINYEEVRLVGKEDPGIAGPEVYWDGVVVYE